MTYPSTQLELDSSQRQQVLMHFLALGRQDRLYRFGSALGDEAVAHYVRDLDFDHDALLGIQDARAKLIGVAHLAFLPERLGQRDAELGLSVLENGRQRGLGSQLFEQAVQRCRHHGISRLYMHCLSTNDAMTHIATRAGMSVSQTSGETDAYLPLTECLA